MHGTLLSTTAIPRYYVYVIRDPRPDKRKARIYVGKGQGKRAYVHLFPSKNYGTTLNRIIRKCRALDLLRPND